MITPSPINIETMVNKITMTTRNKMIMTTNKMINKKIIVKKIVNKMIMVKKIVIKKKTNISNMMRKITIITKKGIDIIKIININIDNL